MQYLVIIRGPLGSGKTTIARKIAEHIQGGYYSVDEVLEKHKLGYDVEDGNISQKSFLKTNEMLIPEAKQILKQNKPVVFDGNFYWKSHLEDLIQKLAVPYHVFTLAVPLQICIERDKYRKKSYGAAATQSVYKRSTSLKYGNSIDNSKSEKNALAQILNLLPER